jgi:hypothetical protein
MLVAGLLLLGLTGDVGIDPPDAPDAERLGLSPATSSELDDQLNAVVERYCERCHSDARLTGNMTLERFDVGEPHADAELAEKVIHKLRAGMMPPAGARRPSEDTLALLATTLENTLDELARRNPEPGYRTFQRLNRAEYEGSVQALFGLDIDASAFLPTETISESFDNIADMQMLSATLLEGYLRAAAHVSRVAVGDPGVAPASAVYKVAKTLSQMEHIEGTPLGTRGGISVVHNFPADGEYVFELDLHPDANGNLYGSTSGVEHLELSLDGERAALFEIDRFMSEGDPNGLRLETLPLRVRAGPHRVSAAFIRKFQGPVIDLVTPIDYTLADSNIGYGVTTAPHLRDLTVSGPFLVTGVSETPSRDVIFTCRPTSPEEERPCAEQILSRLAQQAYRRPLDDRDVADLVRFFEEGREGGGFEVGVRTAIQAMLASPHFVFRVEEAPSGASPGEVYEINDLDLASRLSFFLWSTPPDQALMDVAQRGDLSDPDELGRQALRMLADPRAEALATRFAWLWLRLQDIAKIHPDALEFPYYDHALAEAMERETELLFHHIVQEDASVLDLLDADYTFVNERLADHYGIPNVTGSAFQRVAVPNENRRGLLGHSSILMMTSHANRTSPVLRGKWVMEVLLGSPPPPPPPNVPAFDETDAAADGRELTTRERMEQHRANPSCNSCHSVIDPIGLALENYDVTGVWRIKENEVPIDATGELYDGTPLSGPSDLRNALVAHQTVFLRTFTRNMMAYALGRRVEYYDMPTVRAIERGAAENENRVSSYILGVVKSPAFRMSRAESVTEVRPDRDGGER